MLYERVSVATTVCKKRFMLVRSVATLFPLKLVFQSVVVVTRGDFVNRFNSTLQMVQAAGETNRIQQGLFENYLESRVKDPYLLLVSYLLAVMHPWPISV